MDLVILGGGISGCLLLAAVRATWPGASVQLIEQSERLGGNHTWCFHQADISATSQVWLTDFISHSWPAYEVRFPLYKRVLNSSYFAIRSEDLHDRMMQKFSKWIQLGKSAEPEQFSKQFSNQSAGQLSNSCVIDCRGWPPKSRPGDFGYQKFVGLDVELESPHGLTHVILKDATVEQTDGYRFFYSLPWAPSRLLIEDTYYSNHADLNIPEVDAGIRKYIKDHNWKIKKVHRREIGCLPLDLYRSSEKTSIAAAPIAGKNHQTVLRLGAASGILNPVTGYTVPQTVRSIQALIDCGVFEAQVWEQTLKKVKKTYSSQFRYLRLLNRMMFLAALPEKRFEILQRFYQLSPQLISHFYSAQMTTFEKFRVLFGKPPVPIKKALAVLRDSKSPQKIKKLD